MKLYKQRRLDMGYKLREAWMYSFICTDVNAVADGVM